MSIVGEFTIEAESFALAATLAAVPEVTIEVDRLASHSRMEVMPFLWATGGDRETFRRELPTDPTVDDVTVAEETEDGVLFRVQWVETFEAFIDDMVDHHAAIVKASARSGDWHLVLRFAEADQVSTFQDHFRDRGHRFEVNRLSRPSDPRQEEYGVTAEQYDALVLAVREGYFEIPRRTSGEQLGEKLGISANAVSQRIRRGSEALVRSALVVEEDHDE